MGVNTYAALVVGCRIRTCIHRESGRTLKEMRKENERKMSGYVEFNEMFNLDECTDGTGSLEFRQSGDSYQDDFMSEGIVDKSNIIEEPEFVGIEICSVDRRNGPTWDVLWNEQLVEAQRIVRRTLDELGFDYQLEVALTTVVG